jgi:hypothetical protein
MAARLQRLSPLPGREFVPSQPASLAMSTITLQLLGHGLSKLCVTGSFFHSFQEDRQRVIRMSIWFTLQSHWDNHPPLATAEFSFIANGSNGVAQNRTDLDQVERLGTYLASCTVGIQFLETG